MVYKLVKIYYTIKNLLFLSMCKYLTRSVISYNFPVIQSSFSLNVYRGGIVHLSNISARNRLSILIDGGELSIGYNCFFNNDCSLNCLEKISIGDNTIFGENVKLYDHDHIISDLFRVVEDQYIKKPIYVGCNCWIGANTVILKGVTIHDNVVIGANSLVNKNIDEPGVYIMKNNKLTKIK